MTSVIIQNILPKPPVLFPYTISLEYLVYNRLYCCFLFFSITSSNMSKNVAPSALRSVCMISYPFQETEGVVENNGFEPLTPCVQGRCSSQLS